MRYAQIRELAESASRETEHTHLRRELAASGWQLTAAAERLDVGLTTLRKAVARYPDLAGQVVDGRRTHFKARVDWGEVERPPNDLQVVYAIASSRPRRLKIGTAKRLQSRLSSLAIGVPDGIVVLGWVPGGRAEEKSLHDKLATYRTGGEWFRTAAPVWRALAAFGLCQAKQKL